MEGRCSSAGAAALLAAVQQREAELDAATVGLNECLVAVCSLTATGSRLETAIATMQERLGLRHAERAQGTRANA